MNMIINNPKKYFFWLLLVFFADLQPLLGSETKPNFSNPTYDNQKNLSSNDKSMPSVPSETDSATIENNEINTNNFPRVKSNATSTAIRINRPYYGNMLNTPPAYQEVISQNTQLPYHPAIYLTKRKISKTKMMVIFCAGMVSMFVILTIVGIFAYGHSGDSQTTEFHH